MFQQNLILLEPLKIQDNFIKYKSDNKYKSYKLIIKHIYHDIDLYIDELSYYITLNNERIFCNKENLDESKQYSNIYKPTLISKIKNEDSYISIYQINFSSSKIIKKFSDEVKIILILPFDNKINIINYKLYGEINN